jgi:hypothetical protein
MRIKPTAGPQRRPPCLPVLHHMVEGIARSSRKGAEMLARRTSCPQHRNRFTPRYAQRMGHIFCLTAAVGQEQAQIQIRSLMPPWAPGMPEKVREGTKQKSR